MSSKKPKAPGALPTNTIKPIMVDLDATLRARLVQFRTKRAKGGEEILSTSAAIRLLIQEADVG